MKSVKIASFLLIIGLNFLFLNHLSAQKGADAIVGTWLNQDKDAHIAIEKKGNKYYGKLVWLKFPIDDETKKPKLDKHNPDSKLKSRPVQNLEILSNFVFHSSDNEWNDGDIYDPKSGKTYSCYMVLNNPDELKVRGYIGFSMIGRTNIWTRVKGK